MQIVHSDAVFRVDDAPDYDRGNSLLKLLGLMEGGRLAAARQSYFGEQLQFLVPFEFLELYGPAGADAGILDPAVQDNKTDFQKQNLRNFRTTDCFLVRGWARLGGMEGGLPVPFLRLSYRGGPDSELSRRSGHRLGPELRLWLKVGATATSTLLRVPYNALSDRYEVELWGYEGGDLRQRLDPQGRDALDRGELQQRPDLVQGTASDLDRDRLNDLYMVDVAPSHAMHPILPLHVELAWADAGASVWDSKDGANYHYEFNMILRGWDHFLGVGISPNPHGGLGFLEYRNLMSKYGRYAGRGTGELGRQLNPWNLNGYGTKDHGNGFEPFMSVEYMDLHIMKPECGIGLHRHRDNQEVFLMMEGRGYMVVGDWVKMPGRERCFEIRTLRAGHFAMLKGGQLHGLMNPSDEDCSLFMFGGYD
jgi:hypothetical protein